MVLGDAVYFFALFLATCVIHQRPVHASFLIHVSSHYSNTKLTRTSSFYLPRQGLRDLTRSLVKIHHPPSTHPLYTPLGSPRVYQPPAEPPAGFALVFCLGLFPKYHAHMFTLPSRGDLQNGSLQNMDRQLVGHFGLY